MAEQQTRSTTELRERIATTDALERIAKALEDIAESSPGTVLENIAENTAGIVAELQVLNDQLAKTPGQH